MDIDMDGTAASRSTLQEDALLFFFVVDDRKRSRLFLSSDGANQTRIVSVKSPPLLCLGVPLYNAHRSITAHTATTGLCFFFFVIDQIPNRRVLWFFLLLFRPRRSSFQIWFGHSNGIFSKFFDEKPIQIRTGIEENTLQCCFCVVVETTGTVKETLWEAEQLSTGISQSTNSTVQLYRNALYSIH